MSKIVEIDAERFLNRLKERPFTDLTQDEQESYENLIDCALETFESAMGEKESKKGGDNPILLELNNMKDKLMTAPPRTSKGASNELQSPSQMSSKGPKTRSSTATKGHRLRVGRALAFVNNISPTATKDNDPSAQVPSAITDEFDDSNNDSNRMAELLGAQKVISREETESERRMQSFLTSEIAEMTQSLKGNTMRIQKVRSSPVALLTHCSYRNLTLTLFPLSRWWRRRTQSWRKSSTTPRQILKS